MWQTTFSKGIVACRVVGLHFGESNFGTSLEQPTTLFETVLQESGAKLSILANLWMAISTEFRA
jgi:hypothetical protein